MGTDLVICVVEDVLDEWTVRHVLHPIRNRELWDAFLALPSEPCPRIWFLLLGETRRNCDGWGDRLLSYDAAEVAAAMQRVQGEVYAGPQLWAACAAFLAALPPGARVVLYWK